MGATTIVDMVSGRIAQLRQRKTGQRACAPPSVPFLERVSVVVALVEANDFASKIREIVSANWTLMVLGKLSSVLMNFCRPSSLMNCAAVAW